MLHKIGLILGLGWLATGCAVSMVNKEEVKPVKRIAFISLYADPVLRSEDGPSATEQASSWANTIGIGGDKAKKALADTPVDYGVDAMLQGALKDYQAALGGIKNWQVVEPKEYVNNPAFKAFVAAEEKRWNDYWGKLSKIMPEPSRRYPGLSWALDYDGSKKDALAKDLAQLAAAIGVDAVATLSLRPSYSASTAIGGTGTARLKVDNFLEIYNKHGKVAVHGTFQGRGEDTVAMVNNNILFNDKTKKQLASAVENASSQFKQQIQKEL